MVLDHQTIEKIKSLVYQRPRNINELAHALGKNWRTVDRYVDEIMQRTGNLRTHTFRGGTRGALKIVYWNNTEKIYSSDVQEQLFKQIEIGVEKSDFSPFEIYQYVDADKRSAIAEEIENEKTYQYSVETLAPHFASAQKEICVFAGNLAFIHLKHNKKTIFEYMEECVERKVPIKIITLINLIDLENVERVLALNAGLREPLIKVRHAITPLRAYIFDDAVMKLGEITSGAKKKGQIQNMLAVYYEIRDAEWVAWMQKLFWKNFQGAIKSNLRIENLKSVRRT